VRSAWDAGEPAPLSLRPLYRTWEAMRPNSGLLIHRLRQEPGDLYHFHLGMDESEIPRGHPVPEFLVPGLIQVVGHTRTRRVHRLVGIRQGQEPPYQTAGLPLALDLLPEDSWWLAPLTERQGEPALARIIYSDVWEWGARQPTMCSWWR